MSAKLEDLLPVASRSSRGRAHAPDRLFARLQFLASLLREAPSDDAHGRLLWRNPHGKAMTLAVTRSLTIGRDPACDLALVGARVSRRHCLVHHAKRQDELEDLGSTNGTLVNGTCVRRRVLRDGDVIEVGGVAFGYVRKRIVAP